MKLISMLMIGAAALQAESLPTANEIAERMLRHDAERQSVLHGYTAIRKYTVENKSRKASMSVRATVLADGSKRFDVLDESGSSAIRKHVFRRMLDEESNASRPGMRGQARIAPNNYELTLTGMDTLNDRPAFVMEATPKSESKYLIAGRIWVDATDFAIVRVEGKPAKNPSFWTHSVQFVHTYAKSGAYWFPTQNHTVSDVRIFGKTHLTIEYSNYAPVSPQ